MSKKKYTTPEIEVVMLKNDIIATSGPADPDPPIPTATESKKGIKGFKMNIFG